MRSRRSEKGVALGVVLAGAVALLLLAPVLLGCALIGVLSAFGSGTTVATHDVETVLDGPVRVTSVPLATVAPDLSWPWGQCTWFVAQHHRVTWGGNAADWLANATARGVPSVSSPMVGAIVVYFRGGHYDSADGHVALVVAVSPTEYTVAEMNFLGLGIVDERTLLWPDPEVAGFIP